MMPGTATGTECCSVRTVARAMSSGVHVVVESAPLRTMLGFSRVPSSSTWWSDRALYWATSTRSVTSALFSMLWVPSMRTSGSTMGTKPFSWQMLA